jgi:RNA polymerase primary sigma factor
MAPRRSGAKKAGAEEGGERSPTPEALNAYMRAIAKFEPLSLEEEQVLARRIRDHDDQEALNRLVEANLRFVVAYCKRYRGLGLSFLDLIHEGNLGLIEAAKRFDAERNVKFISYAVWWVRQAIFHTLSEHTRIFRLPQKMSSQMAKVEAARERLSTELERQPTAAEISKAADVPEADVEALLRVIGDDRSLSDSVGDEGTLELGDTLEQDSVPGVEVELMRASFARLMQGMVDDLDEKERDVLRMRFGLNGEEPLTLQEIGDALSLSRERIRQIESKAKEKLRRNREVQSLRGYLN